MRVVKTILRHERTNGYVEGGRRQFKASRPRANGRNLIAPKRTEPIRPVLISQKSNTCVTAQVGRSTRLWKLGALFKDNVCCLCRGRLFKGGSAWREASGSQNSDYRAARVCTKCWDPGGIPDQVVIIKRADIFDIMVGIDREVPCSRLTITEATAAELIRKMSPLLPHYTQHSSPRFRATRQKKERINKG